MIEKKAHERELRGRQTDAMSFRYFSFCSSSIAYSRAFVNSFYTFWAVLFSRISDILVSFFFSIHIRSFSSQQIVVVCMWWLKRSMIYSVSANWKNLLSFQRIFTYFKIPSLTSCLSFLFLILPPSIIFANLTMHSSHHRTEKNIFFYALFLMHSSLRRWNIKEGRIKENLQFFLFERGWSEESVKEF